MALGKKFSMFLMFLGINAYADEQGIENTIEVKDEIESATAVDSSDSGYIHFGNYTQNPYIGMPSLGGTQSISAKDNSESSLLGQLFENGTWNAFGAASYVEQNSFNNYGYAINLFAQTGAVGGFSIGGLMTIANPFFTKQLNPIDEENQAQGLPVAEQVIPQELFAEYQYLDMVQVNAGWIGINNSPWMTYYQNNALNMVTYQGASINVNPGAGWLLSGFAINGAQLLGENGFSKQTMYNSTWDNGTATGNIGTVTSNYTVAIGANWTSPQEMLNAQVWGYDFANYANMLYADTSIKLPVNDDLGFVIGVQGAIQGQNSDGNILNNNGYGNSVSSNMLGASLDFNYSIFGLQLGYNNIWGPSDGYEAGGLISPYTYQYATDPLYTTGWMQGMVERSSGHAYKFAPSLSILNNNLTILPSYQYYATSLIPSSSEYDLQISYNIEQVKGLTVFGGYGYLTNVDEDGGRVSNSVDG